METCDLFVIGGGSGGVRAARKAAERGAKVFLAEQAQLGGTCVNIGCVPKKLFYYSAGFGDECKQAAAYGYEKAALGAMQWQTLRANKDAEIKRLNGIYAKLLADVNVIHAPAQLESATTVQCDGKLYEAKKILLASGGTPARLPIDGAELGVVSEDLFYLDELPKRVVLLGGGYIALEFAGIFAGWGVDTTLCYRADLPLRGMDDDIRQSLVAGMQQHGITIKSGVSPTAIEAIETAQGARRLHFDNGETLDADLVIFATGRKPNTAALNLDKAGITPRKNGTLEVNESFQTTCPSVYAVGDLLQTPALTPVAINEAEVFIRRNFDGDTTAAVNYTTLPTAIFSRPSLATVGISENTARAQNLNIAVYKSRFRPMKTAFANAPDESYIKLIVSTDDDRVLGAQMLGEHASEIMQGVAVALTAGATKADFDATIGIHPTSAEEFVTLRLPQ